ncbi:hypothetical protein PYCC9005_000752 [Savitreella phatthalungensis]
MTELTVGKRAREEVADAPEGPAKRIEIEAESPEAPTNDQTSAQSSTNATGEKAVAPAEQSALPANAIPGEHEPSAKKTGFGSAPGFASAITSSGFSSAFGGFAAAAAAGGGSGFAAASSSEPSSFDALLKADKEKAEVEEDEADGDGVNLDDDRYVAVRGLTQKEIVTGEEDESCIFTSRCKLYALDVRQKDGWKERGVGNLRILEGESGTRLVMRADAVLRVILNSPLMPTYTKVEDGGEALGDKTVRVNGFEDGRPLLYALRCGSRAAALELKVAIERAIKGLSSQNEESDTNESEPRPSTSGTDPAGAPTRDDIDEKV